MLIMHILILEKSLSLRAKRRQIMPINLPGILNYKSISLDYSICGDFYENEMGLPRQTTKKMR